MSETPDQPPTTFVRTATSADAAAIAAVQVAAWHERYRNVLPATALPGAGAATANWQACLAELMAEDLALVAVDGDDVVGVLLAVASDEPDAVPGEVIIQELAVDPALSGAGHGSRLLTAWADLTQSDADRIGSMWLYTGDIGLRSLLGAAGFAPDGAESTLDLFGDGAVTLPLLRVSVTVARMRPVTPLG